MSRHGYSDDCDDNLAMGRWRGQVLSAIRGKRGQAFLNDLIAALEEMPKKRLIRNELRKDGEVCALGALGVKRGLNLEELDPEDYQRVAQEFGIADQLAQEVVYENDECCHSGYTPEERWGRMHAWAKRQLRLL